MKIMHNEESLRRSADIRLRRATKDLEEHTRSGGLKGLSAGLILALLSIGIVYGAHLLLK